MRSRRAPPGAVALPGAVEVEAPVADREAGAGVVARAMEGVLAAVRATEAGEVAPVVEEALAEASVADREAGAGGEEAGVVVEAAVTASAASAAAGDDVKVQATMSSKSFLRHE
jgi:hypothetical protein